VAAEHDLERVRHLADGGAELHGGDGEREQIAIAARTLGEGRERLPHLRRIAAALQFVEPRDLGLAHRGVVDRQDVERLLLLVAGTC
jgi:hypothetical protein